MFKTTLLPTRDIQHLLVETAGDERLVKLPQERLDEHCRQMHVGSGGEHNLIARVHAPLNLLDRRRDH